jgi:hypothetical protein
MPGSKNQKNPRVGLNEKSVRAVCVSISIPPSEESPSVYFNAMHCFRSASL